MKEKEYFRLVKEAEQRFQADLAALKRVWKLSHGGPPPMPKVTRTAPANPLARAVEATNRVIATVEKNVQVMNVARIVAEIVSKIDREFTIHDIAKAIRESYPGVEFQFIYLSSVLVRMKAKGVIKPAKERAGGEPTTYIRA